MTDSGVLCIGHAAWDLIYPLQEFPEEDRKYTVPRIHESPGGPACNAAFLLGRWGIPVSLVATLGDDPYAAAILKQLCEWGVDTSLLRPDRAVHTPLSVVMVNRKTGSRTILTHKNQSIPLSLDTGSGSAASPRIILYDGHETEAALAAIERFPRAMTVFDGGSVRPRWKELVARTDFAIVSERYANQVLGRDRIRDPEEASDCLFILRALGARSIAVTRGAAGCVCLERGSESPVILPAFPAATEDTTAAGDIFHGAFCAALYGLLREGELPPVPCRDSCGGSACGTLARLAAAPRLPSAVVHAGNRPGASPFLRALALAAGAASVSVERRGGRDSIPDRDEAERRAGWR